MQKVITVAIDIEKLQESANGPFTIADVEEINELLEEGWTIEDWELLTGEREQDKTVILVILNDQMGLFELDASEEFTESDPDNGPPEQR